MSVPDEQHIYARWLDGFARAGLAVLAAAFAVYAFGLVEPQIPLQRLPELWTLPLDRYLAASGAPTGWHWLQLLDKAEYLNMVGISLLALASVVCYVRLAVLLARQGDRVPAAIAGLQILVLLAAATNLIGGGH